MHKSGGDAVSLARAIRAGIAAGIHCQVALAPPFTALAAVASEIKGTPLILAAQNVHWEPKGAFTGEISVPMLQDIGCGMVVVGHSERRQYFAENDAELAQKVRVALDRGLLPVLCCGETDAERVAGKTEEKVGGQIDHDLGVVKADELERLAIAYEPIWAIGTGKTATPEIAQETVAFVRSRVRATFGPAADRVRILYGGSVKAANIDELMAQPDIDGVLVGGASLDPQGFSRIVKFAELA